MPITNVYSKGCFSVQVNLGSAKNTVNLILDSGSSTLVVDQGFYHSPSDLSLQSTSYAQCVRYGMGGWYGPVVKTNVEMLSDDKSMNLDGVHVSIAVLKETPGFVGADGILGLAFHELNQAYNLTDYLSSNKLTTKVTYPWKETGIEHESVKDFHQFIKSQPRLSVKPYFSQLEERGISANKFSFVTRRSSIHHKLAELTEQQLIEDPLNQGLFILGGGEEDTDLYQGEFKRIRVIDDVYYNVRLLKVKIDGFDAFEVPKLAGKELERHHSNAFIDTGASLLVLDNVAFNYVIDCFEKINPEFKEILEPFLSFEGVEEGIPLEKLKLDLWPDIEFIFEASVDMDEKEVSLICKADDYWQVNAPKHGEASFKILSQLPGWPDQSILGLPLLSDYYVIFARFENEFGDIKFAQAKN